MNDEPHVWQRPELAKLFLEDVRGAIPLAAEQIDVLLRIVRQAVPKIERLLDLGCGDGILGRAVMAEYPRAAAVFVDFSPAMIEAARQKADHGRSAFVTADLAAKDWTRSVADQQPFDLVVSGLAIHHLSDERKRELYREIFDRLTPGGLFLNLEHVTATSAWAKQAFDDLFIDSLWSFHRRRGEGISREEVADQWYHRADKTENILASVEAQCAWLGEIGFADVDCFFRILELALFGGRKP
jgi:cyclopropane fatty-acyl-phospholipid synthase-like methyltransferase